MKLFGVEPRPWSHRLRWLALLTGAALVAVMMVNQYLATPEVPQHVMSYELADKPERAEELKRQWQQDHSMLPELTLWVDFVFIGLYAVFLVTLANHFLYDRPGIRERKAGGLAKTLLVIGALGDAAENAFLITAIHQPETELWPPMATIATLVKFTGLLVGGACLLVVRAARRQPLQPGDWHH
ncbi:MAG: hypothetical protein ACQERE_09985 [Pseudomonadota bacterium]